MDTDGIMLGQVRDLDINRLTLWMRANITGFRPPLDYAKFEGGQSNPTYQIDAASGSYVLRRKPFGALLPSAHAVDREFSIISKLHPVGFPVPLPLGFCDDPNVIGSEFYIMELVRGSNYRDGSLPRQTQRQRQDIYYEMIDRLAQLHLLDFNSLGLSDFGKPGSYLKRQVGRWTKQYRLSQTDDIPEAERLIDWLPRSLPVQKRTSIVHGDYRIDNIMFEATGSRVLAVLDWELSTIGDPMADFSYLLLNWFIPPDGGAGIEGITGECGIPAARQMIERYCAATGLDDIPNWNWYFAFCQFRQMAIVQGIKKRFIEGNASSALAEAHASRVPVLAKRAWKFSQEELSTS